MTTIAVRGCDILLYVNTGTESIPAWSSVGGQQGATLTEERDVVEKSNKNSVNQVREFGYGFYQWSISCEGMYVPNDGAWIMLTNAIRNAQTVLVRIKEQDVFTLQGLALATSQEIDAPYDDNTTYSLELQGSGPLTPYPA
jgi:TP901-1 family phage major tail protein